jgi:hypothetical protein
MPADQTTPQETLATKRAPRAIRPPSDRDLEIFKRVKIKGYEQWEVAQEHQLHYSRVSQIVKRVARWLSAGGEPTDPLLRDHAARQRLARATLKLRLTRAVELASQSLEFPIPVETTRRRVQGLTEIWREETSRHVPRINLHALRLLIDATQALQKLEDDDKAQGAPQPVSDEDLLRTVFELLCGLRARAELQGRLDAASNIRGCVADALSALLGSDLIQVCRVTLTPPDLSRVGCAHHGNDQVVVRSPDRTAAGTCAASETHAEPAGSETVAQPSESRTQHAVGEAHPTAAVPSAHVGLPTAQPTFPTAQEPLKLSPHPATCSDTTIVSPMTSHDVAASTTEICFPT